MKCGKCGAESVEGDKFCVACGTPLVVPSIPKITQSEASSGQPPVGSTTSGHTKLLKLTCPSCGGALELPDNLTVAHCMYCGTKILLDQDGVVHERRDLQRYIELCSVAVEAKNHNEVIEYCNRILEIDPKNVEAWINKAVSTFWLTTAAYNRYDEAMEYLTKASQIAPVDDRIATARMFLTEQQAQWYNHLGNQQADLAQQTYQSRADYYSFYFSRRDYERYAKQDCAKIALKTMEYYLTAAKYAPDNIVLLENIANCASFFDVVNWSEEVHARIRCLESLRAKKHALYQLPKLKEELQEAQIYLTRLQKQSGFLIGGKIKDAKRRITRIQNEIVELERHNL